MTKPMRYFLYVTLAIAAAVAPSSRALADEAGASNAEVAVAQTEQDGIPPNVLLSFEELWVDSKDQIGGNFELIGADKKYLFVKSGFNYSRIDPKKNTLEKIAESELRNRLFAISYSENGEAVYSVMRRDICEGWCLLFKKPSAIFAIEGPAYGTSLLSRTDKNGTQEQIFGELGWWIQRSDFSRSFDQFVGFLGFDIAEKKLPIFYKWDDETQEWLDILILTPPGWSKNIRFLHSPDSTGEVLLIDANVGHFDRRKYLYDIWTQKLTELDLTKAPELFDFYFSWFDVFELRENGGKDRDQDPRYFVAHGARPGNYEFIVFKVSDDGPDSPEVEVLLVAPAPKFRDDISAAYISPNMLVLAGSSEMNLVQLSNGSVTITPIPLGDLDERGRLSVANAGDGSALLHRRGSDSISKVFKINLRDRPSD